MAIRMLRAEMEKLMGTGYNGGKKLKFTDPEVCKNFLCGLCACDMFDNTKFETPKCTKVHNDELKANFEEAVARGEKYDFQKDFYYYLEGLVKECEQYKRSQLRKVEETNAVNITVDAINQASEVEQCAELATEIGEKLAEAERLGEAGEIDKSMELMRIVEDLKKKKGALEEKLKANDPQIKKLRVCDVCGSFLNIFDNDRRLADHSSGKLHAGRLKIATIFKELQEKDQKEREERRKRERETRDSEKRRNYRDSHNKKTHRRSRSRSRSRHRDHAEPGYRKEKSSIRSPTRPRDRRRSRS
ncbi:putative RNA-binding protein Luc7-like 1 isoform X2 [Zophobas morio]|uniref:putative RNA-binding protein Luc7-like 1 isoform X2 n=1 Tax=Zophobas morio TaxID=2755281 RepID=UPI0030838FCE